MGALKQEKRQLHNNETYNKRPPNLFRSVEDVRLDKADVCPVEIKKSMPTFVL